MCPAPPSPQRCRGGSTSQRGVENAKLSPLCSISRSDFASQVVSVFLFISVVYCLMFKCTTGSPQSGNAPASTSWVLAERKPELSLGLLLTCGHDLDLYYGISEHVIKRALLKRKYNMNSKTDLRRCLYLFLLYLYYPSFTCAPGNELRSSSLHLQTPSTPPPRAISPLSELIAVYFILVTFEARLLKRCGFQSDSKIKQSFKIKLNKLV